jgi:hypothetical protein
MYLHEYIIYIYKKSVSACFFFFLVVHFHNVQPIWTKFHMMEEGIPEDVLDIWRSQILKTPKHKYFFYCSRIIHPIVFRNSKKKMLCLLCRSRWYRFWNTEFPVFQKQIAIYNCSILVTFAEKLLLSTIIIKFNILTSVYHASELDMCFTHGQLYVDQLILSCNKENLYIFIWSVNVQYCLVPISSFLSIYMVVTVVKEMRKHDRKFFGMKLESTFQFIFLKLHNLFHYINMYAIHL